MVLHPVDPNAHYRARRRKARRRRRIRRAGVTVVLVLCAAGVAYAARTISDRQKSGGPTERVNVAQGPTQGVSPLKPPKTMRGVHVTMALASTPGKIDEYLNLPGLNTIELDVKDENGEVGFVASAVPLARDIGAAKPYYKPRLMAKKIHARGVYLIGRVVVMEDPVLSAERPDLAIRTTDGSRWLNHAGLGWVNPYDQRVWDYVVDIAEAAARTGFDEIQFDYVRFPSDGDVEAIVYPGKTSTPPGWVIAQFAQYAAKRLKPLGVRVSADVFGLSATRDLGIGQIPRRIGRYVDAIYPMVYPSHYGSGEYDLLDPNANPGATVAYSLRDFNEQVAPLKAKIIPWLQDFTLNGPPYTLEDIQAQIDSARRAKTGGYLLWNAAGVYTPGAVEVSRWNAR
ncbi:MAG TPA: putative glycoside hydrolase [Gaiellaceae bacterium]|nr:putative glycoside hydrolase [Gaiellaceae bacterium]